jgi:hypothetical protein
VRPGLLDRLGIVPFVRQSVERKVKVFVDAIGVLQRHPAQEQLKRGSKILLVLMLHALQLRNELISAGTLRSIRRILLRLEGFRDHGAITRNPFALERCHSLLNQQGCQLSLLHLFEASRYCLCCRGGPCDNSHCRQGRCHDAQGKVAAEQGKCGTHLRSWLRHGENLRLGVSQLTDRAVSALAANPPMLGEGVQKNEPPPPRLSGKATVTNKPRHLGHVPGVQIRFVIVQLTLTARTPPGYENFYFFRHPYRLATG